MTKKENWLRLIRNDDPCWIGPPWEAFQGYAGQSMFALDPISISAFPGGERDVPRKDAWGVTWRWLSGAPGDKPFITNENKVLSDITQWKEVVEFPPLDGHDWSPFEEICASVDRNEYLVMCLSTGGLFERSHFLMGFEDALCNYMTEQDAMNGLLNAIADWKIGHLERIMDHLKPDVIHYHDDWGNATNLFVPPDVWRKIIKPHQSRIVSTVTSRGVIFMHHADCICEPIVEDMAEIGIDLWQGVIPQNDILYIQKRLGGQMALMGGIDARIIDNPNWDEQVIRGEVRRVVDTYCSNGNFVPCIGSVLPIFPEAGAFYYDELANYGRDFFK